MIACVHCGIYIIVMSLFNVYKSLDLVGVCDEILNRWREDNTFERSIEHCSAVCAPFYEGPPSANGLPGIHHVLSRTIKDVFCRYKSLKGYKVLRNVYFQHLTIFAIRAIYTKIVLIF